MNNKNSKDCTNRETLYMFEDISQLEKKKFIKLWNNSCFDIDELAQTIINNYEQKHPINQDPYTSGEKAQPLFRNKKELMGIIDHEGLEPDFKDKLKVIFNDFIQEYEGHTPKIVKLVNNDLPLFKNLITIIFRTSLVLLSDYTAEFLPSQIALANLREVIDSLPKSLNIGEIFQNKQNKSIGKILKKVDSADATCIHGYGFDLLSVVIFTYDLYYKYEPKKAKKFFDINKNGIYELKDNITGLYEYYICYPSVTNRKITVILYTETKNIFSSNCSRIASIPINEIPITKNSVGDRKVLWKNLDYGNKFNDVYNINRDSAQKAYKNLIQQSWNNKFINHHIKIFDIFYQSINSGKQIPDDWLNITIKKTKKIKIKTQKKQKKQNQSIFDKHLSYENSEAHLKNFLFILDFKMNNLKNDDYKEKIKKVLGMYLYFNFEKYENKESLVYRLLKNNKNIKSGMNVDLLYHEVINEVTKLLGENIGYLSSEIEKIRSELKKPQQNQKEIIDCRINKNRCLELHGNKKICNPDSGRCVNPPKEKKTKKSKKNVNQKGIIDCRINKNRCFELYGDKKICNPDSGRCVNPPKEKKTKKNKQRKPDSPNSLKNNKDKELFENNVVNPHLLGRQEKFKFLLNLDLDLLDTDSDYNKKYRQMLYSYFMANLEMYKNKNSLVFKLLNSNEFIEHHVYNVLRLSIDDLIKEYNEEVDDLVGFNRRYLASKIAEINRTRNINLKKPQQNQKEIIDCRINKKRCFELYGDKKICNPDSGRCVYPPKEKKTKKPKKNGKQKEITDCRINTNRCFELYGREKVCNPLTGRCIGIKIENKKLKESDKQVILVLQSTGDHNNAFEDGDVGLFSVFKQFENFRIVHKKVSSLVDIFKCLQEIKNKQIAHTIIMGHGDVIKQSLLLSTGQSIDKSNYDTLCKHLLPKLATHSSILIHSCCLGKGGPQNKHNLGNLLSNKLKKHLIFASEQKIYQLDLIVTQIIEKNKYLDINYTIDNNKYELYKFYHK